jgi:dienelactone hydrolase
MRQLLVVGLLALLLVLPVACTSGVTSPPINSTPVGDRVPSPPTVTPSPSPNFRSLTVTTADGVTLAGAFYPPASGPTPGVLLLHMLGRQKEDWIHFATRLQEAGYAVLALDLRGHGDSGGAVDWAASSDDVRRAWAMLAAQPEVDPARTAIVGASIGGNLALAAAVDEPQVQAVVLLSPGLDYQGVRTEEAMVAYGERPVLIVASEDDSYAAESAQTLVGLAQGAPVLTLYPGAGHGNEMIEDRPDLTDLILGWLRAQFGT